MKRPWLLAMAMAMVNVVLVAGCAVPESPAQQRIRTDLIRQLEALPGATVKVDIESGLDTGQNNIGVEVELPAAATMAQLNTMADNLVRIIWFSHLDPLGHIGISFTRAGASVPVLPRPDDDDALRAKYGPRPDDIRRWPAPDGALR